MHLIRALRHILHLILERSHGLLMFLIDAINFGSFVPE